MRTVGPYSATIAWQTQSNSAARVVWGPTGMRPLLWSDSPWGTAHAVTLNGLASSTAYVATVEAQSVGGETTSTSLEFTTAHAPAAVTGSTRDGVVFVNGNAFFPLLTWQECPSRWTPEIADGINLFAGNTCTGMSSLLAGVNGRALAAGTSEDAQGTTGPGLLGWFYPDEADGRGLTAAMLTPPGPGLRFLTLTSHFFSGSAPLPDGRGIYPSLVASADVVGFDLYPLQEYCRPDLLPAVFDAQRQLVDLAPKKPTFQWIEVRQMKCVDPATTVTPATIRAESWLAIAAGAHGLGFFPPDWGTTVGNVIGGIAARIRQLEPALLQPALPVSVEPRLPLVRASARTLGGAVYVFAVNAGTQIASVRLALPTLESRQVVVAGSSGTLRANNGTLAVVLPPLSVRIYVAPPPNQ